ncbi:MAG: spore germination protein [Defluviitaleaceae bacterium]|nr:spore germination protein [Defluviitaleaceae bacterium]
MKFFNDKISIRQLQVLLILDIFGTGVIVMPRIAAGIAGENGWVVAIVAMLATVMFAYVAASVGRKFPGVTFVDYTRRLLGNPLGLLVSLGLVAKIMFSISMEMRFFIEILRETMLFHTPYIIIFACMIAVAAYAAGKGFEVRARLCEILVVLVLVPFALVLLMAGLDADYSNLLPVMRRSTVPDVVVGGLFIGSTYKGIEFLMLVHPYVDKPSQVRRAAVHAMAFVGVLITLATVVTIAKFGAAGLERQRWPFLDIMDTINFPGSFIERQDALMMSIWIISVFAILSAGLFFTAVILKDIFKVGERFHYVLAAIPFVLGVSVLPDDIITIGGRLDIVFAVLGLLYMLGVPLLLLLVAKIRKVEGEI